jgi:ferredoxin
VLSSCMEGTCGTCEVDVLDGVPDHRDSFLSPPERESNETMLICVSRCAGKKLTIDL